MRISGTEPLSVIPKVPKQAETERDIEISPQNYKFNPF